MGVFRRKQDPFSKRARNLHSEIEALEHQIKSLNHQLEENLSTPRYRSTTLPGGKSAAPSNPPPSDPIFEPVDHQRIQTEPPPDGQMDAENELGTRKPGMGSAMRRLSNHFRGPPVSNPKLLNYLAAGSIQGLRPLRYEKRVARNRFIVLFVILLAVLWGIVMVFLGR